MSKSAPGVPAPISNRITVVDGQPTTTTRDIAEVFGKRHDDVLRIVRQRMEEAGEWGVRNFTDTPYTDPQNGQTYPVIRMTEKGFMFVVQKFTGKKAVATQIAFVDEFERMRKAIQAANGTQSANQLPSCLPRRFLWTIDNGQEQITPLALDHMVFKGSELPRVIQNANLGRGLLAEVAMACLNQLKGSGDQ